MDEMQRITEEARIKRKIAVDEYTKPKKSATISIRASRGLIDGIDFALPNSDCETAAEFIRVAIAKELAAISVADRVQDSLAEFIDGNTYTRNMIEESVELSNKNTEKMMISFLNLMQENENKNTQLIQKRDQEFRILIDKRDKEFMEITNSLLQIVNQFSS